MKNFEYHNVDELLTYETVEEAIMTCCYVCGDRLEWTLEITYDSTIDSPIITGYSESCGIVFLLKHVSSSTGNYYFIEELSK